MRLNVYETSPDEYRNRVTEAEIPRDLARDRDALLHAVNRAGRLGIEVIGAGWGVDDLVDALDGIYRAMEGITETDGISGSAQEDLDDIPAAAMEGGAHEHKIGEDGTVHAGGAHAHAFLWDGMIVLTNYDGEHTHPDGEEGRTGKEDGHIHFATLPDGRTIQFGSPQEPHEHEKLVGRTTYSGTHKHVAETDGGEVPTLSEEEFLELFSAVEAIAFSGDLARELGIGMVPTGRRAFEEWWALGRGPDKVRRFLVPYAAREAVVEEPPLPLGSLRAVPGTEAPYVLIEGESEQDARVARELRAGDELRAREAAIAAVTQERPVVTLLARDGDSGGYRTVGTFGLASHGHRRAVEEVDRLLGEVTDARCGRVTEAVGDRTWKVIALRAGLSRNGNFWDGTQGEDLARTLEGAPMQAIKYDPRGTRYSHSPFHPRQTKAGLVGNAVGQLLDVRWDPTIEGNTPTQEEAEAIARKMSWTVEEVFERSKGAWVGVAHVDADARWLQEKLESAAERGTLDQYLGLSVDFEIAEPTRVIVPGRRRHIQVRESVSGDAAVLVDYVTRPSAGGAILEAA